MLTYTWNQQQGGDQPLKLSLWLEARNWPTQFRVTGPDPSRVRFVEGHQPYRCLEDHGNYAIFERLWLPLTFNALVRLPSTWADFSSNDWRLPSITILGRFDANDLGYIALNEDDWVEVSLVQPLVTESSARETIGKIVHARPEHIIIRRSHIRGVRL
jgi:hypothetical protein